jgi:chromosome segregation ATPase
MAVTKEEVFEVVTTLTQEGEKPTSINIRERLGTGSYTTISAYLREWQASRKNVSTVESEDVPPEIRESGSRLILAVWASARDWLNRELASVKKAASDQMEEAEAQAQEAMAAIAVIERERDKFASSNDDLTKEQQELRSRNSALEGLLGELREELQREKERNHALAERVTVEASRSAGLEERVKQGEQRSRDLEEEVKTLQAELREHRQAQEQLSLQRNSLQVEKSSLAEKTIDLRQELDRERGRTAEMSERYQALSERLIELTTTQRQIKSEDG